MYPQLNEFALRALHCCISIFCFVLYLLTPLTKKVVTIFLKQSAIEVDGNNGSDLKVIDSRFYSTFAGNGLIGLTDSYVKGYFHCDDLKELLLHLFRNPKTKYLYFHPSIYFQNFFNRHFYFQSDQEIVDLGKNYDEDTFNFNTDEEECRNFSTGYWKHANTLKNAMDEKCELVAKKLKLKPRMTVIDIGCGEGVLCKHLAKNNNVSVTGVNISTEAIRKATKNCRGLDVKYKLEDFRNINGKYDRICCIQLIEAFGVSQLRLFFEKMHNLLTDDGLIFLECTSVNHSYFPSNTGLFEKYCNSTLICHYYLDIANSIDGLFVIEDWQNISIHAIRTLNEELKEMKNQLNLQLISETDKMSLRGSEAAFSFVLAALEARLIHPFQIVLSKKGLTNGYDAFNDTY